jgi:hypothetical protein
VKKTILFLLLFISVCGQSQQLYRPITAIYPIKTFSRDKILALEYRTTLPLVKRVVSDFELNENHRIALLFNGKYQLCLLGNGQFLNYEKQRVLEKIPFDSIFSIEAKYDPNTKISNHDFEFTGSINLFVPASLAFSPKDTAYQDPEPWLDPMTDRLLTLKEEQKPNMHFSGPASTIPRVGLFVGAKVYTQRKIYGPSAALFLGIPVEIPLNTKLSLQSELTYGFAKEDQITNKPSGNSILSVYKIKTFQAAVLMKYFLNPRYIRMHLTAGPYVEMGRSRLEFDYNSPSPTIEKNRKTVFGASIGAGLQFKSGLYAHIALTNTFASEDKLLSLQTKSSPTLTLGWRFGKP